MPGYDGTGPRGAGAMTGGGRGYCAMPADGFSGRPRFGRIPGYGRGQGRRNRYYAAGFTGRRSVDAITEEKAGLIREMEILKRELSDIQSRISGLDGSQEK